MIQRLPWIDLPTEPGYYWFRVNQSTMMRGPVLVRRDVTNGDLIVQVNEVFPRACAHFQRSWCGPLPVPDDWRDELQELRERDYAARKAGA
jgi:hypothetical protein